ncbi:MAG: hypothetical protein A2Y45_04550 [Tenericutes bacterium GWC2_34_14]|nr:MAG: hypothetical protein A2Y45_04550 [Tenericutes bacterium GWC2_34_14]OHE36145.1 MAG: hypothetical protein A2Y46_06990 [Tenericutes bacterium GWF1_35_14]OHE47851.1 MAG: hypothetical protein A2308_00185 [Tenericutes bacterium RIFOXYB2_FULL_36_25]OHE50098.1 MAG: hypothetical protein A2449_10470 [Tenericutes bacterium RIFOXYC2_FULL_35_27]HAX03210.1 hypothetical protein [Acholeplasmataceae bacterium]
MSHSNRGLNEPFYRWIDDVRRAMRKEKELQEKLEFYNMKLIRYKGVSYDRIGSSGSRSSGDSELLYWLDKIDLVEKQIKRYSNIILKYNDFKKSVGIKEALTLDEWISGVVHNKSNRIDVNKIVRSWYKTLG